MSFMDVIWTACMLSSSRHSLLSYIVPGVQSVQKKNKRTSEFNSRSFFDSLKRTKHLTNLQTFKQILTALHFFIFIYYLLIY